MTTKMRREHNGENRSGLVEAPSLIIIMNNGTPFRLKDIGSNPFWSPIVFLDLFCFFPVFFTSPISEYMLV